MKILFTLVVLCIAQKCFAGEMWQNVVVSQQELQEKGVQIRKDVDGGTIPFYAVEIVIDLKKEVGTYQKCGVIVADTRVTPENLEAGDFSGKVERAKRTAYTKGKEFSFTVFGEEHERAFILIEALTGFDRIARMPSYTRYLLPVANIEAAEPPANRVAG